MEKKLVAFYVRNGTFWNARKIAFFLHRTTRLSCTNRQSKYESGVRTTYIDEDGGWIGFVGREEGGDN